MSLKVLMIPHPSKISGNRASGIDQVVVAYARHLPAFDVELAASYDDSYDLIACHAGLTGPVNDVSHLHGMHWSGDYDAPDWEYKVNARIVEAVRHAKQITVPSEWVAETVRRDLRVNPTVIPHGIDWADWQHDEPLGDYVLWNKNREDPYVCDATPLSRLANRFIKQHFVTTFLPKHTGPQDNVHALGLIPHDQMKKLVQSSLVYLATTKETFGIGILEAMAAGVPVLGYAHGGIVDLVEHGVNGWLAEPGDVDALAEGLDYCIRYRKVLGQNGCEMARFWTWERAVAKVAEVYRAAAIPEPPTVGVVIPVYNKSEEELRRAVESVRSQTYDQLTQIIVVDDGSTDAGRYVDLVKDIQREDERVRLIQQSNEGVANARNRGISELRSKYVCCLDADDWLEPTFLEVCIRALESDRSLGIAYTGLHWYKPDGTDGISEWPGAWDYDAQLQRRNQVPTCCVFRRVMWERLGGYRARYCPHGAGSEDAELWLRAGAYGFKAAKVTPEALFNYSWLSGQASGNPEYREVDWTHWHPWTRDGLHPFASYARPKRFSHPVRAYDQPAVSVVIPVGPGHERTVIDALDSLEAQSFRKWEVIVVWDREDAIPGNLSVTYPYVRWVETGGQGAGYARNRGAEIARAPLLLFLDADDWLYPESLKKMVTAWNANQAIVYTDYVGKAIVEKEKIQNLAPDLQARLYHYNENTGQAVIGYKAFDFECEKALLQPELPQPYIWCNVTVLIPRLWHEAVGGFDEEMKSWEDVDYHWRLARAGYCYYHLEEELLVYQFYTGGRRDSGLQNHKSLVKYIQRKYEKEGEPMGCRGCPGGGQPRSARRAAPVPMTGMVANKLAETPGEDEEFIRVKYVKPLRGAHAVSGMHAINPTTGRHFFYGNDVYYGKVITVHRGDVYGTDKRSGQRIIIDSRFQPIEEQTVRLPPSEPAETPPPVSLVEQETRETGEPQLEIEEPGEWADVAKTVGLVKPFDPQALPGVNARIAQAMLAQGLDSTEAVLEAGVEGLVDVPGIGQKKAETIIKKLSE